MYSAASPSPPPDDRRCRRCVSGLRRCRNCGGCSSSGSRSQSSVVCRPSSVVSRQSSDGKPKRCNGRSSSDSGSGCRGVTCSTICLKDDEEPRSTRVTDQHFRWNRAERSTALVWNRTVFFFFFFLSGNTAALDKCNGSRKQNRASNKKSVEKPGCQLLGTNGKIVVYRSLHSF